MIVEPTAARKIVRGEKTTVRRLVRDRDTRVVKRREGSWEKGTSVVRPYLPRIGAHVPIKPHQKQSALCSVVITDVRREPLADMTLQDARAEGHRTRDDFKLAWVKQHDADWLEFTTRLLASLAATEDALLEEFADITAATLRRRLSALRRAGAVTLDDGQWQREENAEALAGVARFDRRWADKIVWVLTIEVERDTPRFLADRRRSDDDYTTSAALALPDDPTPEVIDIAAQAQYSAEARERDALRRGWLDQHALDEKRTLEEQLAHLRQLAKRRNVDVRTDLRVIQRRLDAIKRKIDEQTQRAA